MKKAQITAFIIIGIILLGTSTVYFVLRDETTILKPKDIYVEEKLDPVQNYVHSCVKEVTTEGLRQLGQRSGFLYLDQQFLRDPASRVNLIPGTDAIVPLWFYRGFDTSPTLSQIEEDLTFYVRENAPACLDNIDQDFPQYDIETGAIEPSVMVAEEDIVVTFNYPVKVTQIAKQEISEYEEFIVHVPVRLKKMMELAKELISSENNNPFLEEVTIDAIAGNPNIPFSGLKMQCSRLTWEIPEVKEEVQRWASIAMRNIRVRNTDHVPWLYPEEEYEKWEIPFADYAQGNLPSGSPPEDAYEYFHYYWNFTENDYTDYTIALEYNPAWGMDFIANPSHGNQLRSADFGGTGSLMRFLCVQMYHFSYSIRYPIVVKIFDSMSLEDGYLFKFAMPVLIKDNQPYRSVFAARRIGEFNPGGDICEDVYPDLPALTVRTWDSKGWGIADVNVSFECLGQFCELGVTEPMYGDTRLETQLPSSCRPGTIVATKPGYLEERVQYDGTDIVDVYLKPFKDLSLQAVKHPGYDMTLEKELNNDEYLVIRMMTDDYEATALYDPNVENLTIRLIDGAEEYKVEAFLMWDDKVIGGWMGNWTSSGIEDADTFIFHTYVEEPIPLNDEEQIEVFRYLEEGDYHQIQHEFR